MAEVIREVLSHPHDELNEAWYRRPTAIPDCPAELTLLDQLADCVKHYITDHAQKPMQLWDSIPFERLHLFTLKRIYEAFPALHPKILTAVFEKAGI